MEATINKNKHISVQNISLAYNKNEQVIKDLSFDVLSNECFCIIGQNASGKSTILYSIINQIHPESGNIELAQKKPIIAYLNQDYRQSNLLWDTVIKNITYPLLFQNISESDRYELGKNVIEKLLLDVKPHQKVFKLSGGQQQLISLGRALISNPDIMVCDEPLSAVDITRSLNALKQIEEFRKLRDFPILWVSHNIDEALLVSDKIGLLSKTTKKFHKILSNPLPYSRTTENLALPEMISIKKEILDFLQTETN